MNTIYNVVWNSKTGTWVVASEMAKGRKKAGRSVSGEALVLGTFVLISPALAMAATGTVILGPNATATGDNSIAVGSDAKAIGAGNNVAIGQKSIAGDAWNSTAGSTAIGGYANATGAWASAIGFESDAPGMYSTAFGSAALSSGESSVAIGGATRNAGAVASAKNAVALGAGSRASVEGSVALGFNSIADRAGAVSVGSSTATRQIVNVGKGTADTDAVNVSQLNSAISTVQAGSGSSKYFHVNSSGVDSVASGADSVAIGTNAKAVGVAAIALGQNALTAGNNSTALGGDAKSGDYSVSVGNNANTSASTWAVAAGLNSKVTGKYGVALGATTQVTGDNAVAIGANTIADRANSVSIGSPGSERQITNVAKATADTDAVNLAQLKELAGGAGSAGNKYFHSNSQLADSTAVGSNSVAVGGAASAKGTSGIAIGSSAVVEGDWGIAAGNAASAKKSGDVALGASSYASGGGQDAYATALGANAQATAAKSTALGAGSFATHANSVALGYNSATTADNVVSVGNSALQRKIVFVAKGTAGTDAVNVDQLKGVATAVGADLNTDGSVKKPTITVGGNTYDSVTAAISAVDAKTGSGGGGTSKYFHVNSSGVDSEATGSDSVAIGTKAKAIGVAAIALGQNALTAGNNSTALGGDANSGDYSVSVGNNANTSASTWAVAAGLNSKVTGKYGVALGATTQVTGDNAVAIGANSIAERANSVSVGKTGVEQRQIINVAKGTAGTDAVNVDQLKGVATAVGADLNTDGSVKKPTIIVGGNSYDSVTAAINAVDAKAVSGGSSKYFHTNATLGDSVTTGAESIAIGGNAASDGKWAVALGTNSKATGDNSVALGNSSLADRANSVAVGSATVQRQIINLAKGTADTDAVNVSQLKGVTTALGGGAGVNTDGTIKAPSYTVQGQANADLGTALGKLDTATTANAAAINGLISGGGTNKYFHVNSTGADSAATGTESVAIGSNAKATGAASIALGQDATTTGHNNTAIGGGSKASDKSVSIGNGADTSASSWAVAAGINSKVTGAFGVALGAGTQVTGDNAVAIGANSIAERANSVSVGRTGTEQRQIINVAKGTAGTDAVNVDQLKGVATAIGADLNADGSVKKPTITVGGTAYDNVGAAIDAVAKNGPGNPLGVSYDDSSKALVTLNKGGAATKISNVATGTDAGDAVNKGQLDTAIANSGVAEVASKLKFLKYGPSTALEAQATGADSVAIGGNAFANGASSLALGLNARASANNTVAAGVGALAGADGAVSLGSGSRVQGANSVALGSGSSVAASESWVVSVGSLTNKRRITNLADGVAASDAATVGQVGTAIDKALSTKSRSLVSPLAAPVTTQAATVSTQAATVTTQSATSSVPVDKLIVAGPTTLGGQIEATGTDALAIGLNTHATADSAVSVGQNVNVVSKESVGVGQNVVVNGLHSVVIGSNVSAIVDDAAVFGSGAAVESAGGVAIGSYASVINTAPDSVAIGRNAQALAANTVVLGKGSTDDNRANTFSVGSTLGTSVKRQIINVAKGTVDTDAVNVSQLKGVTSAIGGGAGVNADGTVKAPSYTVQGQAGIADVGSALGKLDTATTANTAAINNLSSGGGSSKYFHANSTGADSVATGSDSVAIGANAKAAGAAGIAVGLNATTTGANNIAIGGNTKAADKSVSIGDSVDTSTQAWAVGLGTNAKVTGTLGTALGAAAQVTGDNAAAIGANSLADRTNSVSVGKSGSERQITNVAKGTADTDAVNVSQLKAAGIVDPTGKTVDAVVYDAGSSKGTVTFGGASGTVLKNVAKGTADTDAVNVSQLKAAGIVDTGGKTVDAVVYDAGSNKGSVSFGGASGTVLKNVAKGTADTDAANLSQLKGVTAAIGGGAAVNPDGTIKAPDYAVGGTTVHTVGDAITNVDGRITNVLNGKAGLVQQSAAGANLTVGKDTDGAAVDFTSKAGATRQLKGIAAGVADTDGVNVKQLNDKLVNLPTNPNAVSYDDSSRTQLTLNKGGAAAKVSNVAAGTAAGDAVNKGQLDSAISGITTSVSDIAPKLKYVKFGASTALDASATGADSVAIGGNAFASNSGALALGLNSRAAANNALAAGAGALAGADSAVALGNNARAQGANSVALGSGSSVAASESWVVSVGSLTNKRRITNLADGTAASDAATVGQVGRAIDTALSSKSRSLVSPLAAAVTTQAAGTSSVPVDKLIVAGPTTLGGQIEASGTNALAIGLNTHASADDAVSVGQNVNVVSKEGVGVGQNVVINGLHSVAVGSNVSAIVDDATVIGSASAVEAAGGVAIGAAASVLSTAADSVAIGRNTQAFAAGTVVLGKGSTDDNRANTVSVGSTLGTAIQRQVINVAKGTADTDAVNVSQLKGVAKAVGGDVNPDGTIKKPTITVGGTAYDNVAAAIEAASKTGGGGADPLGLTYDDSTKAKVTLNKGAGAATIANVKAGVADDEAVNVSQLKASGLIDSTGKTVDAVVYDAGSNKGSVSFGGANGTVLNNVAAGTVDATSKQAINGSQLYTANKSVADAIGGGATVGKDGTVSKPSITVGGTKYDNVEAAIGAVEAKASTGSTLGVAYDDDTKASVTLNKGGAAVTLKNVANATKDDEAVNLAQLKGAGLVADGGKVLDAVVYDAGSDKGTVTFAGANGTVLNNVADGRIEANSRQAVNGGQIAAIKSVLEGKITNIDNRVTNVEQHGGGGAGSPAYVTANGIGGAPKPASAGDSAGVAVGFDSNASGQGASVIGDHAKAAGVDSVAIGNNASTTAAGANSVALGNGSVADRANTVSVGSEGNERTISNVARGNADTDAVNVGLLNERVRDLGASANAYTDKAINDVWSNLSEEIDHSNRQANRGIAAASALINVTPYIPGHVTVNAGVAGYRGESALGVGVSRWSENGRVNLNAGVSAAQGDEPVFRVGVGYIF